MHCSKASFLLKFSAFFLLVVCQAACGGGGGGETQEQVVLRFKAVANGADVGCDSVLTGLGPNGLSSVGISDLRFYISNLKFFDTEGNELSTELVANDFQFVDSSGSVGLIDLTSNVLGSCTNSAIAFSEGTARTNDQIIALVESGNIASVSFDVGVPQSLMKTVVSSYTLEAAPSPLGEMYWSWASGYRHFVFNFTVQDGSNGQGEGYLHLGSGDCGGNGAIALTDRDSCGFVNTPAVSLTGFDPTVNTVTVDLTRALNDLTFVTQLYDSSPPYDIIGTGPGVACHSAPADVQPDCAPIFSNFGLDIANGNAVVSQNKVFSFQ